MPRGSSPGERRGGRQKGAPNKKTKALRAAVEASGSTPLQVMLSNMRFHEHRAALARRRKDEAGEIASRAAAEESANRAAPYTHSRLTAVQMSGGLTMTHEQALEKLK